MASVKRFDTVGKIDSRLIWLEMEIAKLKPIADLGGEDANAIKAKSRLNNLKHELKTLCRRKGFLLTPELPLQ